MAYRVDRLTERDRSLWRALCFVPVWICVAIIPAGIAFFAGAMLAATVEKSLSMAGSQSWEDLVLNRLRSGMTFYEGWGFVSGELPEFMGKGVMLVALLLVAKRFYGRRGKTWITSAAKFRTGQYVIGLTGVGVLASFVMIVTGLMDPAGAYSAALPEGAPLEVGMICMIVVAIVAANAFGEEVLFRGWLMQQVNAFSASPVLVIAVPALLFGVAHLDLYPPRMLQLIVAGLAFGWAAWRLSGIELAAGAHAGFNIAINQFQPVRTVQAHELEKLAQQLGLTAQQTQNIAYLSSPTLMDWAALIAVAVLPAIVAEAVLRFERARKSPEDTSGPA